MTGGSMSTRITSPSSSPHEGKFGRARRGLELVEAPRDEVALEVGVEIEQLVADLAALTDAGLIESVYRRDAWRFQAVESGDLVA